MSGLLITQRQWAHALGISTETFRRWRDAGLIPVPLNLPGHPRWDAAVVASVTASIRQTGTSRFFRSRVRHAAKSAALPYTSQGTVSAPSQEAR